MNAQTFLQYASTMKYYKMLVIGNDTAPFYHQNLCEFYSQPFYRNMIIDLFDNCIFLVGEMYGIGEHHHIEVKSWNNTYSPMGKIFIPFGTLDQFIGDCKRFGIELVWKKEIIEKYFM